MGPGVSLKLQVGHYGPKKAQKSSLHDTDLQVCLFFGFFCNSILHLLVRCNTNSNRRSHEACTSAGCGSDLFTVWLIICVFVPVCVDKM